MKKLVLSLCILLSSIVQAEEQIVDTEPRHAVGLSVGWVVANGLSYRRYFGKQFVQGTFAGAVNKDKDQEYIDASLSYGRYLNTFDLTNGLYPVGLKFISGIEVEHDNNRENDLVSKDINASPDELHVGAGFGFDIGNPNRRGILLSLDVIYTASFRDFKKREFVRLGLLPSISLHYNM